MCAAATLLVAAAPVAAPEETAELPGVVRELFYAIKDSLDYGPEERRPMERWTEYPRVPADLVARLEKEFRVGSYRRIGDDYEIVVIRLGSDAERYRATRTRMDRLVGRDWSAVGGYVYR